MGLASKVSGVLLSATLASAVFAQQPPLPPQEVSPGSLNNPPLTNADRESANSMAPRPTASNTYEGAEKAARLAADAAARATANQSMHYNTSANISNSNTAANAAACTDGYGRVNEACMSASRLTINVIQGSFGDAVAPKDGRFERLTYINAYTTVALRMLTHK